MEWLLMTYCLAGGCAGYEMKFRIDTFATEQECVTRGEEFTATLHAKNPYRTYEYSCRQEPPPAAGKRRP